MSDTKQDEFDKRAQALMDAGQVGLVAAALRDQGKHIEELQEQATFWLEGDPISVDDREYRRLVSIPIRKRTAEQRERLRNLARAITAREQEIDRLRASSARAQQPEQDTLQFLNRWCRHWQIEPGRSTVPQRALDNLGHRLKSWPRTAQQPAPEQDKPAGHGAAGDPQTATISAHETPVGPSAPEQDSVGDQMEEIVESAKAAVRPYRDGFRIGYKLGFGDRGKVPPEPRGDEMREALEKARADLSVGRRYDSTVDSDAVVVAVLRAKMMGVEKGIDAALAAQPAPRGSSEEHKPAGVSTAEETANSEALDDQPRRALHGCQYDPDRKRGSGAWSRERPTEPGYYWLLEPDPNPKHGWKRPTLNCVGIESGRNKKLWVRFFRLMREESLNLLRFNVALWIHIAPPPEAPQ